MLKGEIGQVCIAFSTVSEAEGGPDRRTENNERHG